MTTEVVERLKAALADRYAIERELGQGGMATVYLAQDRRHDRQVAVKVLKPELVAVIGAERFLQEIRVTAHLQHPHILPLFDSGDANGFLFYVMPFVEGESLRDRLSREKQLPVEEAVQITMAVASALDYAHRHKVIHRDIKPENILLHDGQPVVADFGIALAVRVAGGTRITETGLSLGTPHYMSPEQATADRELDGRTDIYSLGCVLYEMLAGEPPHSGATVQAVIAKVLTDTPRALRLSRPTVPPHVDAAAHRALAKLPADRFATAAQFADALAGRALDTSRAGTVAVRPSSLQRLLTSPRTTVVALALAVLGVGAFLLERVRVPDQRMGPTLRFVLPIPEGGRLWDASTGTTLAISPQGDRIAYTLYYGGQPLRLYLREFHQVEPRLLAENMPARNLTFSPDGQWIAFSIASEIRKMSVAGGPAITLGSVAGITPQGLSWGTPDRIVIGSARGVFEIPATGGAPRPMVPGDSTQAIIRWWPLALPDGEHVLVTDVPGAIGSNARLGVLTASTGQIKLLDLPGTFPLGVLNRHLVFTAPAGALLAVPFDTRRAATRGGVTPVIEEVVTDPLGGAIASLSASGTLVYLGGRSGSQPVLVDRAGNATPLVREARVFTAPRFSPDGTRLALAVRSTAADDIWILDLERHTFTRLTTEGTNVRPEWTPDGRRVLFRSDRGGRPGIWWQPADGSAPAEPLRQLDEDVYEAVLSPDGRWLIYRTAPGASHPWDIFAVPLQGGGEPVPLVVGPFIDVMPRLSPDGRWLVYRSSESGQSEVYVRPFPGPGARVQVSTEGGDEPLWARDGRTLYYRSGGQLIAVSVTTGATFSIGSRRVIVTGDYLTNPSHANWDVTPDGRGFLMLRRAGEGAQVIVVQNWGRELDARMAGR